MLLQGGARPADSYANRAYASFRSANGLLVEEDKDAARAEVTE